MNSKARSHLAKGQSHFIVKASGNLFGGCKINSQLSILIQKTHYEIPSVPLPAVNRTKHQPIWINSKRKAANEKPDPLYDKVKATEICRRMNRME